MKPTVPVYDWDRLRPTTWAGSLAVIKRRSNRLGRVLLAAAVWVGLVLVTLAYLRHRQSPKAIAPASKVEGEFWAAFPPLDGFYNGRKTIVSPDELVPEQHATSSEASKNPSIPKPIRLRPYRDDPSRQQCFLDAHDTIPAPSIYAYPGIPQHMTSPALGSLDVFGVDSGLCYDRYGRYGAYGLGYEEAKGGLGMRQGDVEDIDFVWEKEQIDYRQVRWGHAQEKCENKNGARLHKFPRTAFVLRTWNTLHYTPQIILMLRAMINELALASGGEYTVHFLIHVQDPDIPIWADEATYNETLKHSLPPEFEGMGTLWSEPQMELIYGNAEDFGPSFENMSGGKLITAYRSLHFPLQYWSSRHPEFDFVWSWEMDIRATGHYYDILHTATEWAKKQPRELLWERNARFYIQSLHGPWESFCKTVEEEATSDPSYPPVTGPQPPVEAEPRLSSMRIDTSWPKDGEPDLLTFNPIFDPNGTAWIFNSDITGYNVNYTKPPRRSSLVTATRLSRRLLRLMHEETYQLHHTMFPEMYPGSIALHYGLKAVYVPMPVYFDRHWPPEALGKKLNSARLNSTGGAPSSPFGPREHVFRGASWYSNANFAGALWRRWLGHKENGKGGPDWELGVEDAPGKHLGTGRMCLRSTLIHPVKFE